MPADLLEFEEPVGVLLKEIEALSMLPRTPERERSIETLRSRADEIRTEIFANLTAWQRVLVARHPNRPNTLDYAANATVVTVDLGAEAATGTGGIAQILSVLGSAGADTLIGPGAATTWQVTGANAGVVGAVSFSGIEHLTGGAAQDTFVLADTGSVSGALAGGLGEDVLIGPDAASTWDITGADAGQVNGSAFSSLENLLGGAAADAFILGAAASVSGTVGGGSGIDRVRGADKRNRWRITGAGSAALDGVSLTGVEQVDGGSDEYELVGPDGDATWSITGPGAGTVGGLAFSGMEDLTGAAANADTFVVEAGGSLSGVVEGGALNWGNGE